MVPGRDDGGRLLRGWRPRGRVLATVLFLCGVLLISHPLVGGLTNFVGLTGTAEYDVVEIQPDGDSFVYGDRTDTDGDARERALSGDSVDGIDCYPWGFGRECSLEAGLIDDEVTTEGEPAGWSGYTYHDGFYERVSREVENGTTLGLRSVPARAVLANVSIPERDWPERTAAVVDNGGTTVQPPLEAAGHILERDGDFYVIVHESGPTEPPQPPGRYQTALSVLLGILSIQAAFRIRRRSLR